MMSVFFIFRFVLNQICNHVQRFVVGLLHLAAGVAGCEAGHIDILQHVHDGVELLVAYLALLEAGAHGLAAELREGDVVFVGQAAPDGFVDFLVELLGGAGAQQGICPAEPFLCQTYGAFHLHAGHIGFRLAAALQEVGPGAFGGEDESGQRPEEPSAAFGGADRLQTGYGVDIVDVAVEVADILFDGGVGAAVAFGDFDLLGLDFARDILAGGGVEEDEPQGRYGEVALAARDEHPLEGAAAADAGIALADIVVDLRVVDLEHGGELGLGCFDEHQVAAAGDGYGVGDGLVGFYLVEVESAPDVEAADGAAEAFGCAGQGFDVDGDAVGGDYEAAYGYLYHLGAGTGA